MAFAGESDRASVLDGRDIWAAALDQPKICPSHDGSAMSLDLKSSTPANIICILSHRKFAHANVTCILTPDDALKIFERLCKLIV